MLNILLYKCKRMMMNCWQMFSFKPKNKVSCWKKNIETLSYDYAVKMFLRADDDELINHRVVVHLFGKAFADTIRRFGKIEEKTGRIVYHKSLLQRLVNDELCVDKDRHSKCKLYKYQQTVALLQ